MDRIPACRQAGKFPNPQDMPCLVYAIKSDVDGRIYVGFTSDLEKRIKEHNSGKTKSTKSYRPWKLLYKEEVANRLEARQREKYLKSGVGKEFLKSL